MATRAHKVIHTFTRLLSAAQTSVLRRSRQGDGSWRGRGSMERPCKSIELSRLLRYSSLGMRRIRGGRLELLRHYADLMSRRWWHTMTWPLIHPHQLQAQLIAT